jgi:hypothetical protein
MWFHIGQSREILTKWSAKTGSYPQTALSGLALHRHRRKTVVNQQFAFVSVHVNQYPLRGLSLAAVAGDSVSVVEMQTVRVFGNNSFQFAFPQANDQNIYSVYYTFP